MKFLKKCDYNKQKLFLKLSDPTVLNSETWVEVEISSITLGIYGD